MASRLFRTGLLRLEVYLRPLRVLNEALVWLPLVRVWIAWLPSGQFWTGRAVNGLSWCKTDCVGERKAEKTGGVRILSKKTPCEREPFLLLHGLQHETMLSILIASSGALLTGMM